MSIIYLSHVITINKKYNQDSNFEILKNYLHLSTINHNKNGFQ